MDEIVVRDLGDYEKVVDSYVPDKIRPPIKKVPPPPANRTLRGFKWRSDES